MKTLKSLAMLVMMISMIACSQEEETPDYVAESIGSYNYTATATLIADRNQQVTDNGTVTIARSGDQLVITLDGDALFTSVVNAASNGYAFNLTRASFVDSQGDAYDLVGITSSTQDGVSYHGRYDGASKQLFFNLRSDYADSQYDQYNAEYEIIATRR